MIDTIIQNWKWIGLGIIFFIILIVGIVYRKQLLKKIKSEFVTFIAMLVSIGLFIYGFSENPEIETQTLATMFGREVSLVIPLVWVFAIILIIALIIFFRKELMKDIKLG